MQTLVQIGLTNAVLAATLALIVTVLARFIRAPALVHTLWLLVLVKLVTPPLVELPVAFFDERTATPPVVASRGVEASEQVWSVAVDEDAQSASSAAQVFTSARSWPAATMMQGLAAVWLLGSAIWLAIVLRRIAVFNHFVRHTQTAPPEMQERTARLAGRLRIQSAPQVRLVEGVLPPLLWSVGRGLTILLPRDLLVSLSAEQQETMLLHELAHVRRRDHWMRLFELVVLCVYWWHPVAWFARRKLNEAEEQCCDAWVTSLLPAKARDYARAMLETVEFIARARPALPAVATGFGSVHPVTRRLDMILAGGIPKSLTRRAKLTLFAVCAAILPWFPSLADDSDVPINSDAGVIGTINKDGDEVPTSAALSRTDEETADAPKQGVPVLSELPVVGDLFGVEARKPGAADAEKATPKAEGKAASKQRTVRRIFRPTAEVAKGASWSQLFHMSGSGDKNLLTALITAHLGDKFPVQKDGKTLFEVRVAAGNDEQIVVEVLASDRKTTHTLIRDKPVQVEVDGRKFTLQYGSTVVASEEPQVFADDVHLSISHRVERGRTKHHSDESRARDLDPGVKP